MYEPLKIDTIQTVGFHAAALAMRLPKNTSVSTGLASDLELMSQLVRRGDSHAKCVRGIILYVRMEFQAGWMIELDTYRHGREVLSTSSSMHNELANLSGPELAEQKQADLADKVYTQICTFSAQTLRRIYIERRKHRHPDWQIFCDWIEGSRYFEYAIMPEKGKK